MYGTTGASTYEETHANVNSSTIKTKVDSWYEENMKDTEYEQYISDTLFCNDRSFRSSNTGTGIGDVYTSYNYASTGTGGVNLKCVQQNDRFTVSDEVLGNGSLTYPVGLLTDDEGYLAGGGSSNSGYYLYTGNLYWTMSPSGFDGSSAFVRSVSSTGYVYDDGYVGSSRGVRPVLSLKSGSLTGGQGTASDPYTV